MKRRVALGIALGAVALAACQVIAGIDRVEKVDATSAGEAGPSPDGSSGGVVANDPCTHVLPPPITDAAAGNDPTELPPLYLVTSALSLTKPADNGIAGFDLDRSCTCDKRPGTNLDGAQPCTMRKGNSACDKFDGGIDNAAGALFGLLPNSADLDKQFTDDATDGVRSIVIFVKGWNGLRDDFSVDVGIWVSNGAVKANPEDKVNLEDGSGVWTYPSGVGPGLGGVIGPQSSIPKGYVANGTLVVTNAGTVPILLGRNGLIFNEALIVGDLSQDPTTKITKFTGVVGGRIRDTDLLVAAGQLRIGGDTPACQYQDDTTHLNLFDQALKPSICAAVDITESQNSDFKGGECNSISSAIAVTAYSAKVADQQKDPDPDPDNPCSPTDPKNATRYSCNN